MTGRVVVTGGSGKLGRAVVTDLREQGWEVINADRTPPRAPDPAHLQIELTDLGQVLQAFSAIDDRYDSVDAVVHLGAIPAPGSTANATIFQNNLVSTYNVFAAARQTGITNLVWASSETLLGIPFDLPPPYLPVDEDYPARPETSYSLAKHLEEQLAEQFCRWNPRLKAIGLRFSNVMEPADYQDFPSFDADASARCWNLWAYIDARDGAQAVRRALDLDATGFDVFVIANADTVMSRSTADLAAERFPGVELRQQLGEHETLLSIAKARRVLGYEPEHSWRD
jgi:nucleoside-diphosphate-sugar epimerase